jgi:hypothetical protein
VVVLGCIPTSKGDYFKLGENEVIKPTKIHELQLDPDSRKKGSYKII